MLHLLAQTTQAVAQSSFTTGNAIALLVTLLATRSEAVAGFVSPLLDRLFPAKLNGWKLIIGAAILVLNMGVAQLGYESDETYHAIYVLASVVCDVGIVHKAAWDKLSSTTSAANPGQ